tara:strand:- start:497 stop:1135 length:639 start_codon:yes stop_codon:yes gene_type:complete
MNKSPKIVFIIGMHRCGTSLLSNCLIENGFSIGKTKNKDKDWQNPNGYFENDAFTRIHDKLLKYNKCSWCSIRTNKMKYTQEHVQLYRKLITSEFVNEKLLLIKDPRLTFFVDFLKEVCGNNYEYKFLFLIRNKEECCNSLSKAQNKLYSEASKLYDITMSYYTTDFLKINHNDIINHNNDVLTIIAKFCNFPLIKNTEKIVDDKLYRHRNT